jgi:hypothetical protein
MLIVRNSFVAKPGCASKLAAIFKEAIKAAEIEKARVLTDLTGEFNTVIFEYETENLGGYEAMMARYATSDALKEKMKGYTDLWVSGSRQIFQVH